MGVSWCVNKGGVGVGDRVVSVLGVSWCVNKGGAGGADMVVYCWCCCWLGTRVMLVLVARRVMLVLVLVATRVMLVLVLVATRVMLVAGCETRDHGLFEMDFHPQDKPRFL